MSLPKSISILDAIEDQNLFAPWFRDRGNWATWFVFLRTLFGLPMVDEDLSTFQRFTGRATAPTGPSQEAWLICGRRGGKSRVLALIAVYLATFFSWARFLTPGERGTVMVLACDRRQARVIFGYIRAFLTEVPMLTQLVVREGAEFIELSNNIIIEIHTGSFRSVRGYTIVAALLDEIAFWPTDDAASPDFEVLTALRPAMATIPGAMLLAASSPYAKRGVLYQAYRKHYGHPSPVLVWHATTRDMNPTVRQETIDAAMEEDPNAAAAEWLAQFRSDIETFISRDVVDAVTNTGCYELPFIKTINYAGFVDPSGGSNDSMTLAIAHRDKDGRGILDAVREVRPPFSPESVVMDFAQLLKSYGMHTVTGDRYGGEWPRERFREHGIKYEISERSKSDLYRELLPLLNSTKIELLDHPRLTAQLVSLERRTARGGRDSIDHAPGAHDDIANAVAGVLVNVAGKMDILEIWSRCGVGYTAGTRAQPILTTR